MSKVWSWRQAIFESDIPATTKLVLAALGSHLNDMGGAMFPSQERLAKLCSLTERSVITHLEIAEKEGWIKSDLRRLDGKQWAAKCYYATWPQEVNLVHPNSDGVNDVPTWGETPSSNGVKDVHTNSPLEHSIEVSIINKTKETKNATRGQRLEEYLEKCNAWLIVFGISIPRDFADFAGSELEWTGDRAAKVFEEFRDYWRGVAGAKGVKADWPATWRNWCRREAKNGSRGGGAGKGASDNLSTALRASVANRYGGARSGGVDNGNEATKPAEPDTSGAPERLPIGEIPF